MGIIEWFKTNGITPSTTHHIPRSKKGFQNNPFLFFIRSKFESPNKAKAIEAITTPIVKRFGIISLKAKSFGESNFEVMIPEILKK
jgi:hypothetical protein